MSIPEKNEDLSVSQIKGCGPIALLVFLGIWILLLSGLSLFVRWSFEQTMFESNQGIFDGRWIIHLVTTGLLAVAIIPAYFFSKIPRLKLAFKTWMFAAVFSLLTVPVKTLYLTAQVPVFSYLTIEGVRFRARRPE